jgi:Fe-S cluster assembly protein SufB
MPEMNTDSTLVDDEYQYGFITEVETDEIPKGLNEDTIRLLSAKKEEPEWMLERRLKAFRWWETREEPTWAHVNYEPVDYQNIRYYSAPKNFSDRFKNEDGDIDPEVIKTFEKLGIPVTEQSRFEGVAVDAVFDSVSVSTTHTDVLEELGIIFCSISEAIREHPELVQKYLSKVVPDRDNFFASLNAAVFTDGSFVYVPPGVKCPIELSTYFRINAADTGQFERTLIIADKGSYVSYLEGCTAPQRDENQLHAAVVELIAEEDAQIKYATIQNWYSGDKDGKGGIYNFVTKRGHCKGDRSKISWTQVETGAAITWKYPSCILQGDDTVGEFYSVAVTNHKMQADTGTKMIHLGNRSKSTIVSKGISADQSINTYRGLVHIAPDAADCRNYSICDSMLIGSECTANTVPYIEVENHSAVMEHEATTSKINEEQLFYIKSRGIDEESAINLVVNGFCKEVFKQLPMEFAVEATKLLEMKLEGSIG